ncbi:MAG: hypothetical protein WDN09_04025 [bacterium]
MKNVTGGEPTFSKRERKFLEHLSHDLITPEIAKEMNITFPEAESMHDAIRAKMGAEGPGTMMTYAFKHQLIDKQTTHRRAA